ncbi:anthranilate phosphoribosyltransferase [Nibricoccus sp. IMCC34717]|uniref:anthranilate phosphoribosyltransferase n=1 Tax=Nibricoccus sp. IMCC34717 TaxID=3034021 RepID=UPI00384DF592
MSLLTTLANDLERGVSLPPGAIAEVAAVLAAPGDDEAKAAFLIALARKGETPEEVAGFARTFREWAVDPGVGRWAPEAIDIVGTGGDHAGGFNISSLVVLTLASAGVKVMKHGNRGVTSKCGSADLISALGFQLDAPPEKLRAALEQLGYVFFFAPAFHPAFKHIAPVRKALGAQGKRSIFNILGPLINPGRPAHILFGVFSETWVETLARALGELGTKSGLAAHGRIAEGRGIDELTTATANRVRGIGALAALDEVWEPGRFGIAPRPFAELQGGDLAENLALTEAILANRGPEGLVDTIVLNSAVALWILGRVKTVEEALPQVRELLLGGAVKAKIEATRQFFSA